MANSIKRGFFNKFNRGEVGEDSLAREDITPIENSCVLMKDFLPSRLGQMQYRPGTEFIPGTVDDNVVMVPFITSIDDPIILIFEENSGSPRVKFFKTATDTFLLTDTTFNIVWDNGEFSTAFAVGEWVDADEGTATSVISGGVVTMTGTGSDAAKIYQTAGGTVANAQVYTCIIEVVKGSVKVDIGQNGVDSAELFSGALQVGVHYINVTASGTAAITATIYNDSNVDAKVDRFELDNISVGSIVSIDLETAIGGDAGTPNFLDSGDLTGLRTLRWAQSADVMFFCGANFIPFVIKRRNALSFSVERFVSLYGPYEPINVSSITMNPTGPVDGDMEVVSSRSFFNDSKDLSVAYGTPIKFAVNGQNVDVTSGAVNAATGGVFVFGTGDARKIIINVFVNSGAGYTVELQKSFDEITWLPVATYTTPQVGITYDDGLDAAEVFYQLEITVIGTANLTLAIDYDYGTLESQGRISSRASSTSVGVEWYVPLGIDQTVNDWYIGSWGGDRKYPRAVGFYEGRLWFAGNNKVWGSESDFYESFDRNLEGASASIERTIGFGSSEEIFWLAPSARLVIGSASAEIDVRSSNEGVTLTDFNTNLKPGSDLGCADVMPVVLDQEVFMVQRGGNKLIGLGFQLDSEKHAITDFNVLHPNLLSNGIVRLVYVRNPETRIFAIMTDGTVNVLIRDQTENVLGWSRLTIQRDNGSGPVTDPVRDLAVVPGEPEDRIYAITDQGATGTFLKFAQTTEVNTTSASRHFDRYQVFASPGSTTLQLDLNGYSPGDIVYALVDGTKLGPFTVDGATQITSVTGADVAAIVTVGFEYKAQYNSNKLTDYDDVGALNSRKRILDTGLIMRDYVPGSLKIGPTLTTLQNMPAEEDGKTPVPGDYDFYPFIYSGRSETDPRIAMEATGPCRILAYSYNVKSTAHKTQESN